MAHGLYDSTDGHQVTYRGLSQEKFDEKYGKPKESVLTLRETLAQYRARCGALCNRKSALGFIERRVPGIRVLRTYEFRSNILGDIIAGLSVGVVTVPQSLGYAILASVPPILGLYTCFIPALVYFLFGTSRHIAMGTMALSSLIIGTAVEKGTVELQQMIKDAGPTNNTNLTSMLEEQQINIAVSVTFLGGIFLILMSFVQLGFILSYMGEAFVSGYLCGANIRVLTHQIIFCLGLKEHLSTHIGPLDYFYLLFDIFANIQNVNVASLVTSIITLGIVLAVKYGINEKFKSKLKVPVPIELIVVVAGILVSHFAKFEERFGVRVLKHVPQGLPRPTIPSSSYLKDYALEAILTGIVSFVFAGMMAKLFSQRHDYPLDNNQELFASGMCNAVGGLFSCIGVSVSPPRAFLMEMTGGKTQVAYLINAVIILLTLLFLAPYLVALPVCILACLIVTSCIPLFTHYTACIPYWKANKYDFSIWLVTAVATLAIGVDIGMILGVGYSFVVIIFQSQLPYTTSLGRHEEDGVLLDKKKYSSSVPVHGVAVFRFESPLYFATLDIFKQNLFASTVSISQLKRDQKSHSSESKNENLKSMTGGISMKPSVEIIVEDEEGRTQDTNLNTPLTQRKSRIVDDTTSDRLQAIVIDCSCVPFADTPGARLLAKLRKDYLDLGVEFILASCSHKLQSLIQRVSECSDLMDNGVFPSVQDAIMFGLSQDFDDSL